MKVCFNVEIDESETEKSVQELLDIGLEALGQSYSELGCYFNIGYNPELVTKGRQN